MQSYFVWSGGHTHAYEYYCLKNILCLLVVNSVDQSLTTANFIQGLVPATAKYNSMRLEYEISQLKVTCICKTIVCHNMSYLWDKDYGCYLKDEGNWGSEKMKRLAWGYSFKVPWSKSHLLTQSPDHFPIHHSEIQQYGKNSPWDSISTCTIVLHRLSTVFFM